MKKLILLFVSCFLIANIAQAMDDAPKSPPYRPPVLRGLRCLDAASCPGSPYTKKVADSVKKWASYDPFVAILCGHGVVQFQEWLCEIGDITTVDDFGNTLLITACMAENNTYAEILLSHPNISRIINAVNKAGKSALHVVIDQILAKEKKTAILLLLLAHETLSVNQLDGEGNTARSLVQKALKNGRTKILLHVRGLLIRRGAITSKSVAFLNSMQGAAAVNNIELMQFLIAAENINAIRCYKKTILDVVCSALNREEVGSDREVCLQRMVNALAAAGAKTFKELKVASEDADDDEF